MWSLFKYVHGKVTQRKVGKNPVLPLLQTRTHLIHHSSEETHRLLPEPLRQV